MGRYYTDAEFAAAVRRQIDMDRGYSTQIQTALQQQNRVWLYQLVRGAASIVFGSVIADVVFLGVDAVWEFFSDLFSG